MVDLCLPSLPTADLGLGPFFGQHLTSTELDAELLSRLDPSRFKGFADLTDTAWFGYRFAPPGLRVLLFLHYYRLSYDKTARFIGKRWVKPPWMKPNPLLHMKKEHFTSLVTATATADTHGIPYEFYLDKMMELHLRGHVEGPLKPNQLYLERNVSRTIDTWEERNVSGIYTAKCPQLAASAYEGHPIQNAYQDFLCAAIANKGNKPFYIARLMFDIGHLVEERAIAAFGADAVRRAYDHK